MKLMDVIHDHPVMVAVIILLAPPVAPFLTRPRKVKQPQHRAWTDSELRTLLNDLGAGVPMEIAAAKMSRSLSEVVRHLEGLGIFRKG